MRLVLLMALQAVPAFDLATLAKRESGCSEAVAGEITVCGRRDTERYRLKPLTGEYAENAVRAETGLGGGTIGVVTEQVQVGNAISKRAMIRFSTKLGISR